MSQLPRELYVEQRSFEQYDAIDFFDFCSFSSDQRQEATFVWKTIILPLVQQGDLAQHGRLVIAWDESKYTRQKYWESKQKKEKRDAQLDDHIDHVRNDAIKQTQRVSNSITQEVGERLQGIPTTPIGSSALSSGAQTLGSHSTIPFTSTSSGDFLNIMQNKSAGKRTAARTPQTSNKKRSGGTMARRKNVGLEEGLDSVETVDEHNNACGENVVDGQKVDKSMRAGNEDQTVVGGIDDDQDDQADDQYEVDGEGEQATDDLIQELQELEEESEPGFRPLIRALYHAARGEPFEKPQHKPQLSLCQSFLYDYVWNRLDMFLELPTVKKTDKKTIEKKDVFVAISGIVDLDVHKDFPQRAELLSKCRAAIDLQYPKIRDHLQTYHQFVDDNDGLKEARLEELMKRLKEDVSRFEDNSDEMVTIEILRILVKQSMPDKYDRVKPTESSTLYVWFSIWKLLFSSTAVDVQIGETILKEAQQDQLAVRKVVGPRAAKGTAGASGRRLDFRLVASIRKGREFIPFTLCNNEHKAPYTNLQVIQIQHRKNMRLNKSIAMNGWIPRDTSTMFQDVVGLQGDWNIIIPYGDVMLSCMAEDEPLILPANEYEMGTFLCGDAMERLLGYREHILSLTRKSQKYVSNPTRPSTRPSPSTLPPLTEFLSWIPPSFYSPASAKTRDTHVNRRTPSPSLMPRPMRRTR